MARFACRKGYFPLHKGTKRNKNETDKEESAENDDAISMNSESLDEEMSDSEEEEEEKQQVVRLRDLKDCKMEASTGMNCPTKALRKKKYSRAVKNNRKFREEINTNIVSESFDVILEEAQLAAGEPVFCQNCKSVFNKYSKLEDKCDNEEEKEVQVEESLQRKPPSQEEQEIDQNQDPLDEQTWICEFCYQKNKVMIEKEEIPTNEYVHYVLGMDEDKMRKDNDTNSVIFCLDVSGSMCVTTPVEGKLKIKGDKLKELQELMKFSDGSDQFYHGKRNHTYISRLQCVQAAIEAQIIEMAEKSPDIKVGLVSFSNDVNIHGDCSDAPLTISGDKLQNYDLLLQNGIESTETHLQKPIREVSDKINGKLYELEESGPTALGPALLTSVAMASQGSAGSSVVLCTDGLSNVGLGSIEGKAQEDALEFYTKVADYAHSKGITVNIISIAGEECDLETLRCISEKTGGDIQRVEADKLTENFANILSSPIIATDVKMKVILNKGLEFRNEDESQLNQMKNIFTKSYGNVTAESEITFEYKIKSKQELESNVDFDFEKLTHLPFQTQIFYTKLDGMKCIRVNSHQQEISTDKKEVEAEADSELLGINCVQQAAKIANRGDFRHAQAYMKCTRKYWGNNTNNLSAAKEVKDNLRKIKGVYGMLQVQNDKEELQKLGEMDKEKEPEMQSMVGTSPPFMEKIMREDGTLNKEDSASMTKNNKISYKKPNVGGKRYRSKLDDEATSKLHNMNKFSSKRKKL